MPRDKGITETSRQGIAYVLVGGGTALLELGLFQVLFELLKLPLAVSNVSATVVATAVNFLLNRNVTFKSTSNPMRSLVLYIVLFGANMAISTFMIGALVSLGLPSAVAKLIMQVCVVIWNFVLYRTVIFV